ncbi:element excision factor XisH family protein [Desulfococcaceae bacterium HSG9]|nr:element excision factor XisH family protein [Desulfococcaceae bacterium HSG9]
MAARDIFHDSVRNRLQKEGWKITHDPLSVIVSGVEIAIDLGAEKSKLHQGSDQKIQPVIFDNRL